MRRKASYTHACRGDVQAVSDCEQPRPELTTLTHGGKYHLPRRKKTRFVFISYQDITAQLSWSLATDRKCAFWWRTSVWVGPKRNSCLVISYSSTKLTSIQASACLAGGRVEVWQQLSAYQKRFFLLLNFLFARSSQNPYIRSNFKIWIFFWKLEGNWKEKKYRAEWLILCLRAGLGRTCAILLHLCCLFCRVGSAYSFFI